MRIVRRFIFTVAAAVLFLAILTILLRATPKLPPTLQHTRSPTRGGHPYIKPTPRPWHPPHPKSASARTPVSQLIVKVHLPDEDISWLSSLAPTWTNNLIPIDARFTHLHAGAQKVDKGRVVAAYLTWIIENYHNLPSYIVFLAPTPQHEDKTNTRTSTANTKTAQHIKALHLPSLQSTSFAPLPCPPPAACAAALTPFARAPHELRTLEVNMASIWHALFNGTRVPTALAVVPGAQFAVSRAAVLERGVREYEGFWAWLQRTKMDDESAGRVMEYLWPVVFGVKDGVCGADGMCV